MYINAAKSDGSSVEIDNEVIKIDVNAFSGLSQMWMGKI